MTEIDNLNSIPEAIVPHVDQSRRSSSEQDHFRGQGQTSTNRFLTQQRSNAIDRVKRANIGGRVVISNGTPLVITFVLSKNTARIDLSGFGRGANGSIRTPNRP